MPSIAYIGGGHFRGTLRHARGGTRGESSIMEPKLQNQTSEQLGTSDEAPPQPGIAPPTPGMIAMTEAQLSERLERARDAFARDQFGTKDLSAVKARLARLTELEQGEVDRKRASQTEQERLSADLTAALSQTEKAMAELAQLQFEGRIMRAAAALGVKNTDYAAWVVSRQPGASALSAAEIEAVLLAESSVSDGAKAAFGMVLAPTVVNTGINSTSGVGGPAPEVLGRPGTKTSMDLTADEWRVKRSTYGI